MDFNHHESSNIEFELQNHDPQSASRELHETTPMGITSHTFLTHLDGPNAYRPQKIPIDMRHQDRQIRVGPRVAPPIRNPNSNPTTVQQPHQTHRINTGPVHLSQSSRQNHVTESAYKGLLPFCTIGPPLNETQVVALSDVVGSLKELVLLVLAAHEGDDGEMKKLIRAVGEEAAAGIVQFWKDEWVADY